MKFIHCAFYMSNMPWRFMPINFIVNFNAVFCCFVHNHTKAHIFCTLRLHIHTCIYIIHTYMKPRAKLFILVFLMQMVATEDTQSSEIQNTTDNTGAFEKLKQTLSSSLLTAQDKGKCKCKCYRSLMIITPPHQPKIGCNAISFFIMIQFD